jgi:poly(A) polymerase
MHTLSTWWFRQYPAVIRGSLGKIAGSCPEMFVTGGTVRDLLAGRVPCDLDITVPRHAFACAHLFAQETGGTFVPLDEQEGVARVVWQKYIIDFAQFREGTDRIEADLCKRDFTINALAVPLRIEAGGLRPTEQVLDPTGGYTDFARKVIRATSENIFKADPLRLLRAHRFAATLGFTIDEPLKVLIAEHCQLLSESAPERVSAELQQIMASCRAHSQFVQMAAAGLLWVLFPDRGKEMRAYLETAPHKVRLKWAAFFHDLGKPATFQIRNERTTFYGHDRLGAQQFTDLAIRLRWSKEETKQVARLIDLHMWPFHLQNARQRTGLTARACLRLVKAAGEDLTGLFLLAMADSLAGQGPGKPANMEESLAALYSQVDELYRKSIKPLFDQPRMLSGHDLQNIFGLSPSPLLGKLLRGLEEAQVAGEVQDRQEAIKWIDSQLHRLSEEHSPSRA